MTHTPGLPGEPGRATASTLGLVERFQAALQRGERAALVESARQLVDVRAPLAGQWFPLAMIAAHNGEIGLAREAFELYLESVGGDPAALARKADLLAQIGAWEEVMTLMRALPADLPSPAGYAYTRGSAALYLGESEEARHYLAEATRLAPWGGSPWLSLGMVVDFADEADLADRLIAAERGMEAAAPAERASYYYALGKMHADRSEHERAFSAYARGAALMRSVAAYDRAQDRRSAAESLDGYDQNSIAELARRQSEPTGRAILVMGLPRSGSTLVEQILTSHSAVSDGAEIYRLGLLAKEVGGVSAAAVRRYGEEGGAPAAARLWRHWLDERFPVPGRVVDKTLDNTRLLGLAAAMLPQAPLIWMTRDPLDCAWSCFRTRFAGALPWSHDLEDIAFHIRLETEALGHWQQLLGERLLVVPYEALVTQPEAWTSRILSHCGLAAEPQVLAPHENHRPVTTASAMQVRRPIYRDGIGTAEPYRPFLEPFIRAYGD